MIPIKDVNDAWIADFNSALKVSLGLVTVEPHSSEFDDKVLEELVPIAPAILLRYAGLKPVEGERKSGGASGLNRQLYRATFISHSLLGTQDASNGCYDMMDAFRDRYDGKVLNIPGHGEIALRLESENFILSEAGLIAYDAEYSFNDG